MSPTSAPESAPDSTPESAPRYRRALLKISGEAFCKPDRPGIDSDELALIAGEIASAAQQGCQLAVVVGGGNIVRGGALAQAGHLPRASADYMGMLGTAINGIALKEALETLGQPARVLSAIDISSVAETYIRGRAIRHLEKGRVVVFVCGTGNPFFTTDSAASLRAAEIEADVLLKATKVDGIYDKDPHKHPDAVRFDRLTFDDAIRQKLGVMDLTAFSMCMERNIPIVVFDMKTPGHIAAVVAGQDHGTRVVSA
ncbi:MAG: UMP kinase [Planctomycetota bacterium]